MKKIKVLQLGSPGELYGAERWILALVKYLDINTIETWVASIRDEPELEASICHEAEKYGLHMKIFDAYGKFNFSAISQLKRFIVDQDIDIIHTHHYKTDIIGLLSTRGTKCKAVSTPHGWSKAMDFKLCCYELMDRCIFPFFDAVVPLSEDIYRPLTYIPGLKNKLELIINGVDVSEIDEASVSIEKLEELENENYYIIGYIGQIIYRKGLDILLKAVAKINTIDWRLILIGEGEQRDELELLASSLNISDRVMFLGFRADRLSLLKKFDCFVLPSKLEGIPRCLMEALTAGIPVLASDIPGCRDLIEDKETGILFRQDRPDELSEKVAMLAHDTKLQEKLKRNGRNLIIEKFSAERMAVNYTKLYSSLVPVK
ncbi:MAG: glycosyltransferase [Nitrospira sp.]|nr:glycosyltransferase [Nitrospira sp.]